MDTRRQVRSELRTLDVEAHHRRISELLLTRVYGDKLFHAALLVTSSWRQVAVPAVARIIYQGGTSDTITATEKRIDDTIVFIGLMYRHGPDSAIGGATIDKLAAMHRGMRITDPDQYRHFIASIIFEPARIGALLGLDAYTPRETHAHFLLWREIGRRWGIEVPEDEPELLAWLHRYEQDHFAPSEEATLLMQAVVDDFARRFFPGPLRPLGKGFLCALVDQPLLDAVGWSAPSPAVRRLTTMGTRAYIRARRLVPCGRDRLLTAWTGEYGNVEPSPADVGPAWAARYNASMCPFGHDRSN